MIYVGSAGPALRNQMIGKSCALFHPKNSHEPIGLSVIESMACGTPPNSYNKGSMPVLIDHGNNGFLVSDCVEAVEHGARLKDVDRSDCRRTVEDRFTVDRMVEKYLEVYTQVLEEVNKDLRTAKPLRTKHQ